MGDVGMSPATTTNLGQEQNSRDAVSPSSEDAEAPSYLVSRRTFSAIEIPAIVEDVDRAVKGFGRASSLTHTLDPTRNSIPFYLNPESPFCQPIMSHKAASHNVVLKIVVPKRTGRKRKRGTDGPWQGDTDINDAPASAGSSEIDSNARRDHPTTLRRKLEDNIDRYQVQAVGVIKHTHRFRGLADFYWDMSKSSFAQRYVDQVLPGDVSKLKEFQFDPGRDSGPNADIIPPPLFTHMSLPFNYYYSQNPYVRSTEDGGTINTTAVKQVGYFIGVEDTVPDGPQSHPDMTNYRLVEIIAQLEEAFQDRAIWTRRSLLNHLGGKLRNWNELKKYLSYTAYQFKGGPWRDGVVPYGIDPRSDPKYRIYQTLMFKLPTQRHPHKDQTWQSLRKSRLGTVDQTDGSSQSHIFDGETYYTDGKVWQVCDITDPLLKDLLDNAEVRPTWDPTSGWYHGGLWSKVKAIMKTKLLAIQFGRILTRRDFAPALSCGDRTPTREAGSTVHIPLPNLRLTEGEIKTLRGHHPPKKKGSDVVQGSAGYKARFGNSSRLSSHATQETSMTADSDAQMEVEGQYEGGDVDLDAGSSSDDSDDDGHEDDVATDDNDDVADASDEGDNDDPDDEEDDEVAEDDEDAEEGFSISNGLRNENVMRIPYTSDQQLPHADGTAPLGSLAAGSHCTPTHSPQQTYTVRSENDEDEEHVDYLTDVNASVYPELD